MRSVLSCLLFAHLSVQLPWSRRSPGLEARAHVYSPHSTSLKRYVPSSPHRLLNRQSGSVVDNEHIRYLLPITIGTQTFDAEIDSGSSDTWIIQQGLQCYSSVDASAQTFSDPISLDQCNFGTGYSPDSSYQQIQDVHQFTCYGGNGRCVEGPLGTTPVTFCGLTVQQTVGAVDQSSYHAAGDPEQSGIIGLAFSAITSEYTSTNEAETYSPIMQTIFEANPSLPQYFSLALSRDAANNGNGGIMTIGGVPAFEDPTVNVSSDSYTSAPLIDLSFYTISVDGFVVGQSTEDASTQVIVDSGAPSLDVPQDVADSVNSLWSPSVDSEGNLDCHAVLTEPFGITIGGATYYISSEDLIQDNGDSTCSSLVNGQDSGYILGDPFLKNVLAIYDWGNSQMAFYPRTEYES